MGWASEVFADGPIGWWRLGDASGNALDGAGGGYDLTPNGAPTYGVAANATLVEDGDTAMTFATTDWLSRAADDDVFDPGVGSMTWEFLIATTQATNGSVYRKANAGTGGVTISVNGNAHQVRFVCVGSGGAPSITFDTTGMTIDDGNWHHVVCVLDRSTDTMYIYVDGGNIFSTSAAALSGNNINSTAALLWPGHTGATLAASLDELAIYNYALSADRVLAHYSAGINAGAATPGVQGAGHILLGPQPRPEILYTLLRPGRQPLPLTPVANTLRFSTLAVGGFGSASLTLPGTPQRWKQEIPYLSKLVITAGPRVLWEGQVEDLTLRLSKGELSTSIVAYGLKRRLEENTLLHIWSTRTFDWQDLPWSQDAPQAWGFQTGRIDQTNYTKVGVRWQGTGAAALTGTFSHVTRVAVAWLPTGVTAHRLYYDWNRDGDTGLRGYVGYLSSGAFSSDVTETSSVSAHSDTFPTVKPDNIALAIGVNATPYTPAATDAGKFYYMRAVCEHTLNEDVGSAGDATSGGWYGGTLLANLISYAPDLYAGTIEAGSDFTIGSFERWQRDTLKNMVDEVVGYYTREWGIWEDGRFDWKSPDLNQPQWIATLPELAGLELQGSIDEVSKTLYIAYDDAAAALQLGATNNETSAASTDQRNPYVKNGTAKDIVVAPSFPMTSVSAAQLATKLSADQGGPPTVHGMIAIPANAYVGHTLHGALPAAFIRAGENIVIPDLPKSDPIQTGPDSETLFHIVSTDYDETKQTITLEVEGFTKRGDVLLARLAAATRTLTG